jgi:hypothetical protein
MTLGGVVGLADVCHHYHPFPGDRGAKRKVRIILRHKFVGSGVEVQLEIGAKPTQIGFPGIELP